MAQMFQGDEIDIVVTITSGSIENSTDLKFVLERDDENKLQKTKLGGGISEDSSTQLTISLDKDDTINLPAGKYKWQGLLIDSSNKERVLDFSDDSILIKERLAFS